ncbi:MAG: hypothetical protein AAGF44_06490, partial [Pseudomonadota bacterium]
EVYWSDVVVTGRGAVDILISLIRVILGLGHIVRESASITYNDHPVMRRLTDAAIYCIHGPIAAMNTVLLVGAIVALMARRYADAELDLRWSLIIALPIAAYGWYHMTHTVSYLWRSYWKWLVLTGLLMSVMALLITHVEEHMPPVASEDRAVQEQLWEIRRDFCTPEPGLAGVPRRALCSTATVLESVETNALSLVCVRVDLLSGGNRTCKAELRGVYLLGVYIMLLQQGTWMITLSLMGVILFSHMVLWIWSRSDPRHPRTPSVAPVALSAMALMWILVLCCVWAVGFFFDERFTANYDLFKAAFFLVWVNWAFALLIALVTAMIFALPYRAWIRRLKKSGYLVKRPARSAAGTLHQPGMRPREEGYIVAPGRAGEVPPEPAPRLIVARPLALLTMFCPLVLISLGLISTLRDRALMFHEITWMNWVADQAHDYFEVMLGMSALVGLALFAFREQLRVGIGLGSDVINYFRVLDYAPRRQERVFHFRARIERRFIAVARAMCARHDPDEVVVVAHSQGTVVALDVLRDGKVADLIGPDRPWKLITMGSPYTHIYGKYFPRDFKLPGRMATGLSAWTNIFRIDDFVGTHIGPQDGKAISDWPKEYAVGPRGHTNYWVDIEVVPILREQLFD